MADFLIMVVAMTLGTIIGVSIMWQVKGMDELEQRLKWFEMISGMEDE